MSSDEVVLLLENRPRRAGRAPLRLHETFDL